VQMSHCPSHRENGHGGNKGHESQDNGVGLQCDLGGVDNPA
jgi:hypothetical protein